MKPEFVPYFSVYAESRDNLNNLFDETFQCANSTSDGNGLGEMAASVDMAEDDVSSESCETIDFDPLLSFPRPLPSTSEGLTKREGDTFSGNIPFTTTVNKFYISLQFIK